MQRAGVALIAVALLLVAGCSGPAAPETPTPSPVPTERPTPDQPDGWNEAGLVNATAAVEGADAAIADRDYVERRVLVRPAPDVVTGDAIVQVLTVHVDRDHHRLLTAERAYLVSNETAVAVAGGELAPIESTTPYDQKLTYIAESQAFQYRNKTPGGLQVRPLDSADFASAVDRPLPAVFATFAETLTTGRFTGGSRSDAGFRYTVENVSGAGWTNGSGHVVVRPDGLVTAMSLSERGDAQRLALWYELSVGNTTVATPVWAE